MSTSDAGQRTGIRYTTGKARVIVRGDAVVVLPGEGTGADEADPAAGLWADLATPGAGVAEVLGTLTTSAVGGLKGVPPFAVVVLTGAGTGKPASAHVVARGDGLTVTIETGDESQTVSGAGVISWTERVVDGVTAVEVATGVSGFGSFAEGLPVESGVVLAGVVRHQVVEPAGPVVEWSGEPASSLIESAPPAGPVSSLIESAPSAGSVSPLVEPLVPTGSASRTAVEPLVSTGSASGTPVETGGSAAEVPVEPGSATVAAMGTVTMVPASEETFAPDGEIGGEAPSPAPEAEVAQEEAPDEDDYMHLWGATVAHGVEAAAVRPESEEEGEDEPAPASGAAPAVPPPPPAPPVPAPALPDTALPDTADPGPDGMISGAPISGVPGWPGATPAAAHRAAAVGGEAEAADDDHDGHTVMSSAIADLKAAASAPSAPKFSAPANPNAPRILAVTCENGHANPTARENCRECGSALSAEAELAARPSLGRMVVTSGAATAGAAGVRGGQVVELDRAVIVGRRPRTNNTSADQMPRLVTVSSPQQDISRSHTAISLEDWHVLVTDLATTNGTTLLRPGQPARRLHPNEKEHVSDGDVVDLGDGVTLTFEGIW
ncbi:FHA domain-containing protein [Promicromonospora umidemergens]|uniref:FHA domain-containing protein n=1 Tax=Promicromonospora umidemergens TaxID=629679 RepID=A0ABP8X0P2_9MICO|nr:FHA domain-containing protein [Promicromonospora umidemergens]MCP2286095.1 FHA domain-containing protein [Promicromonospora umidemergens]